MITTPITSCSYKLFFSCDKDFKVYFLSNFQICKTALLTVDTILFIMSSELIYLITSSWYLLINFNILRTPDIKCECRHGGVGAPIHSSWGWKIATATLKNQLINYFSDPIIHIYVCVCIYIYIYIYIYIHRYTFFFSRYPPLCCIASDYIILPSAI